MNAVEKLSSQKIITRAELLQLWNRVEEEKMNKAIEVCVAEIKRLVINTATTSHVSFMWKSTRSLIAAQFNISAVEVDDSLADEASVMIIQKLRDIFPDCSIDRCVGKNMYGAIISDSIKVSWN